MPLEFVGDAISLSGLTGTRLKCDVIGAYYPFWWKITSGGKNMQYERPTAIVELHAATGEDYIKSTGKTVLGSAGHALDLKVNHLEEDEVDTSSLKVILVEDNAECYAHLKRVIKRRWSSIPIEQAEGPLESNSSNVYLLNENLDDALAVIENISLGNAIYCFDPLRSVEWTAVEKVARKRIRNAFKTGTEFVIFLFTSDWFLGRDEFAPLPETIQQEQWSDQQKATVREADFLFGNQEWRKYILNTEKVQNRQDWFITLYRVRLLKWFRYVLAMPFAPKKEQLFHLVLCSNYEAGVKMTRDSYASKTGNPAYLPGRSPHEKAYVMFKTIHPEAVTGLSGKQKPLAWRILWRTIKYHESGMCDCLCKDFEALEQNEVLIESALNWLHSKGYLKQIDIEKAWQHSITRYMIEWQTIKSSLNVDLPPALKPISPEEIGKFLWHQAATEALKSKEES
jgi:three-Cys-motif partner protein